MDKKRLFTLVERYRDGDMSESDAQELAEAIRSDDDAAQSVLEDIEMSGLIGQVFDDMGSDAFVRAFFERVKSEKDSKKFIDAFRQQSKEPSLSSPKKRSGTGRNYSQRRAMRKKGSSWAIIASIAACIAIIIGVHFHNVEQAEEAPELIRATLIQMSQDVTVRRDENPVPAAAGMDIRAGDTIETRQGQKAALQYNGEETLISISEKTEITVDEEDGAKRITLEKGEVECKVAPQPVNADMVLITPHAEIKVVGTKFRVFVDKRGNATSAEVEEGKIHITRKEDREAVEINEGYGTVIASGMPLVLNKISAKGSSHFSGYPNRFTGRAFWIPEPITHDGKIESGEWSGWEGNPGFVIREKANRKGYGQRPSYAYVMYDEENLYVGFRNKISDTASLEKNKIEVWNKDDGGEVCFQAIHTHNSKGEIYVLRGYPSGKFESSTEAGASASAAHRLGEAVEFASSIGIKEWTAEYVIPWSAANIDLNNLLYLRFNLGVFKESENEWIAWIGTGCQNWLVHKAGILVLTPPVKAGAENVLKNPDIATGGYILSKRYSATLDTSDRDDAGGEYLWVKEGVDGGTCLKIISEDKTFSKQKGGITQRIISPGPGNYVLSYLLKVQGLSRMGYKSNFLTYIRGYNGNVSRGKDIDLASSEKALKDRDFYWRRHELVVTVPADAREIGITFKLNGAGTVWMDKIVLQRAYP